MSRVCRSGSRVCRGGSRSLSCRPYLSIRSIQPTLDFRRSWEVVRITSLPFTLPLPTTFTLPPSSRCHPSAVEGRQTQCENDRKSEKRRKSKIPKTLPNRVVVSRARGRSNREARLYRIDAGAMLYSRRSGRQRRCSVRAGSRVRLSVEVLAETHSSVTRTSLSSRRVQGAELVRMLLETDTELHTFDRFGTKYDFLAKKSLK